MDANFFILNALIPFTTALAGSAGGKALSPIFTVFDNWFYVTFGSESDLKAKKRKLQVEKQTIAYEAELEKEQNIGKLKQEIVSEVQRIDPEKLVIPDKQYVATIMESVEHYLGVDDVRLMFSKLLASSVNGDFTEYVHPAIVDAVKQLTAKDAELIRLLYLSAGFVLRSDVRFISNDIRTHMSIGVEGLEVGGYIIRRNEECDTFNLVAGEDLLSKLECLDNNFEGPISILKRLGIIEIFSNNKLQLSFINTTEHIKAAKKMVEKNEAYQKYFNELKKDFNNVEALIKMDIIEFTAFGKQLANLLYSNEKNSGLVLSVDQNNMVPTIIRAKD
ncbi:DUF4393 domain-containing protein [Latilactobacillus curvatus]|uniref:Abi-alpha family protein n=1 Tax=Latilactobacillus curvatus TaxID=28038 RepID=UPI0024114DAB|nr:Abi-alpha family protein [Latilactobacillus curvatus]MDG2979281.1 DUF4393 domain-containing protein [Latilactobacillus curvatus]